MSIGLLVNSIEATIYEVELYEEGLEGTMPQAYRLITTVNTGIPTWELYRIELEWEEGHDSYYLDEDYKWRKADAVASFAGMSLLLCGTGKAVYEKEAVEFVRQQVMEFYSCDQSVG